MSITNDDYAVNTKTMEENCVTNIPIESEANHTQTVIQNNKNSKEKDVVKDAINTLPERANNPRNSDLTTIDVVFRHLKSVENIEKNLKKMDDVINNKIDNLISTMNPTRKFGVFTKIYNLLDYDMELQNDDELKTHMVRTPHFIRYR